MTSTIISQRSSTKNLLAALLGNVFEHYDTALYALLVPFLTPLFFSHLPYITGLIIAYGIQAIGIVIRPLGALVFGFFGDRYGRKKTLSTTLMGMAIVTVLMGLLPTYHQIGSLSPLLLLLLRGLQNFFAGGEVRGGAIFALEHTKNSWRGFIGSLYDSSTVLGILLASGLVAVLASFHLVEEYWRFLFFFGALSGFIGVVIRWLGHETFDYQNEKKTAPTIFKTLSHNRRTIVILILAAGFSYVTYAIPFTLMNGFLPLISSITKAEAVQMNTTLLFFDMLLLPLFGFATRWIAPERLMKIATMSSALLAIPFFLLLYHPTMMNAIIARTGIVILGIAFAAPFHQWILALIPVKERFLVTAFGISLGTQLIGAPCTAVCLWLYKLSGWVIAPAFYLLLASVGGFLALRYCEKTKNPATEPAIS